ncbi:MAG: fatty acid desaturase [Chloroflexota bacterium]
MTTAQATEAKQSKGKVTWYRVPVDRHVFKKLNERSDKQGAIAVGGHLGLIILTGIAAWYAWGRLPWWSLLIILFLHGTFYSFLFNGSHELSHNTVFKTRWLNKLFMRIFSFMVWRSYIFFETSHAEHHKYTLHPPDDLEVVLPVPLTLRGFLRGSIVDPWTGFLTIKATIRLALGRLEGEWEHMLFPPEAVEKRRMLFNWARFLLVGHGAIVAVSVIFGWWLLPILITFAPFYGGLLRYLCNNTQHAGLQDNVPDFRLCCRTFIVHPFISFLYWNMNYHTEHHMYAAVPCYNLKKMHEAIKHEMPECTVGLYATWKEIIAILRAQKTDPTYQYAPDLPGTATAQ